VFSRADPAPHVLHDLARRCPLLAFILGRCDLHAELLGQGDHQLDCLKGVQDIQLEKTNIGILTDLLGPSNSGEKLMTFSAVDMDE